MLKKQIPVLLMVCACCASSVFSGELPKEEKVKFVWMSCIATHMEYSAKLIVWAKDVVRDLKDDYPQKKELQTTLKKCEQLQDSARAYFRNNNPGDALYCAAEVAMLIDPLGQDNVKSEEFMQALHSSRLELIQSIIDVSLIVFSDMIENDPAMKDFLLNSRFEAAGKIRNNQFFYGLTITLRNNSELGKSMFEGVTYDGWRKFVESP